jgi:hypothetical protein
VQELLFGLRELASSKYYLLGIGMITAQEFYDQIKKTPSISSGDPVVDQILRGGFLPGPIHLITGHSALLSTLLMRTAVNACAARVDGGGEYQQIAYIDGENTFNPYFISKYAISKQLTPTYILDRIFVSRTFTWNQMVEVVEEKISTLDHVDMVLISGLTSMFEENLKPNTEPHNKMPGYNASQPSSEINWKAFQDVNRMIAGLKKVIQKRDPLIVLTGPFNSKSRSRPAGGHLMAHLGGILVGIDDQERYRDYFLYQHPFLPFQTQRIWKTVESRGNSLSKRHLNHDPHNLTLDSFCKQK